MTYNIHGCRGADGRVDPERILRVIADAAPDIVALQEVDAAAGQLAHLAERLGMRGYGHPGSGNAFLSVHPLRGIQAYDLGGGCCLRADLDLAGKRLHLFNLRLDPTARRGQIAGLLGPEVLGNRSLACPVLLLGDFADRWLGAGNVHLALRLRKARRPLWSATYPARFPLVGRDRAYLCGEVQVTGARIPRSALARRASTHLPLILTVQIQDPRSYLQIEKLGRNRMEIAPG
jgi:endonuclease/exonuclease/phosphatase family metal-dependent hydrolase